MKRRMHFEKIQVFIFVAFVLLLIKSTGNLNFQLTHLMQYNFVPLDGSIVSNMYHSKQSEVFKIHRLQLNFSFIYTF